MMGILLTLLACGSTYPEPAISDDGKFHFIDIRDSANMQLDDNFGSGREGNNLSALKRNEQELEGVTFKIADTFIQLGSKLHAVPKPDKVLGIKLNSTFSKLYLLHATGYGSNQRGIPIEQDPNYIPDDTQIAEYRLHYQDGTVERIPVIYGKDVRDWWYAEGSKGLSRGKVAWEGESPLAKKSEKKLRLYLTTWTNPHPSTKVTSIDYLKVGETVAGPFCIAITTEK